MLWNSDLAYLYMPRTASKSLNSFFASTWRYPLFGTASPAHLQEIKRVAQGPAFIQQAKGHESLKQVLDILYRYGRTLDSFEKLIFVTRNPYSLVFSNYNFLRSMAKSNPQNKNAALASKSSFDEFCRTILHPDPSNWVKQNGKYPSNLHILNFERLEASVLDLQSQLMLPETQELPHLNKGEARFDPERNLTKSSEKIIYEKYAELFQIGQYERLN